MLAISSSDRLIREIDRDNEGDPTAFSRDIERGNDFVLPAPFWLGDCCVPFATMTEPSPANLTTNSSLGGASVLFESHREITAVAVWTGIGSMRLGHARAFFVPPFLSQ